jgi:hypothetical protein
MVPDMNRRRFLNCFGSGCILVAAGCAILRRREEGASASNDELEEIAACGLDCGECPIRRMPFDEVAAASVIAWFRREGWLKEEEGLAEALERHMYCEGCHGDRSIHWDAECWILHCCVDDKGLDNCSRCDGFPCDRLEDWARKGARYDEALERLRRMRSTPSI